jgi:hypothetical protein
MRTLPCWHCLMCGRWAMLSNCVHVALMRSPRNPQERKLPAAFGASCIVVSHFPIGSINNPKATPGQCCGCWLPSALCGWRPSGWRSFGPSAVVWHGTIRRWGGAWAIPNEAKKDVTRTPSDRFRLSAGNVEGAFFYNLLICSIAVIRSDLN